MATGANTTPLGNPRFMGPRPSMPSGGGGGGSLLRPSYITAAGGPPPQTLVERDPNLVPASGGLTQGPLQMNMVTPMGMVTGGPISLGGPMLSQMPPGFAGFSGSFPSTESNFQNTDASQYNMQASEEDGGITGPGNQEQHSDGRKRSRSRDRKRRSRSRSRDRRRRSRSRSRDRRRRSRSRERHRGRSRSRDRRSRSRGRGGSSRSRSRDKGDRDRDNNQSQREQLVTNNTGVAATMMLPQMPRPSVSPWDQLPPGTTIINTNNNNNLNPPVIINENSQEDSREARRERRKRSRWGGGAEDKVFIPGMPTILPGNMTQEQERAYLLQLQIEELTRRLRMDDLGIPANPEERSPSPEPVYNAQGKRMNTREFRVRRRIEDERHGLVQEMLKLNPDFKPPADYKPPSIRISEKVSIPQEQYPDINFVGLLLGPRGNTLKNLEKDTGAKITIRGKGSTREGKVGKDGQPHPGEDEPLHALCSGLTTDAVQKAVKKISQIIKDVIETPEGQNDLRRSQLRELALLNGTLREGDDSFMRCNNCGANTHKSWQCPDRPNVTNNVICAACGGAGHIARDCRNKGASGGLGWGGQGGGMGGAGLGGGGPGNAKIDEEYMSLMAELGEGPPPEMQQSHDQGSHRSHFGGSGVLGGGRGGPMKALGAAGGPHEQRLEDGQGPPSGPMTGESGLQGGFGAPAQNNGGGWRADGGSFVRGGWRGARPGGFSRGGPGGWGGSNRGQWNRGPRGPPPRVPPLGPRNDGPGGMDQMPPWGGPMGGMGGGPMGTPSMGNMGGPMGGGGMMPPWSQHTPPPNMYSVPPPWMFGGPPPMCPPPGASESQGPPNAPSSGGAGGNVEDASNENNGIDFASLLSAPPPPPPP
ncbi:splicing factor 1-like [Tropilaelaps mercedesae]|uniref:Splicing factor 1 n=1 Tax=Tropilaelaps mercedesae TaxID=418985 RepID=A0A1V9XGP6_9ACAR|nr:splicing factor 1-like [Tropilaelaps mercedesae]